MLLTLQLLTGFLLLALLETLNGILRVRYLLRLLGRRRALVVSFVSGTVLMTLAHVVLIPWIGPRTFAQAMGIGLLWSALMIGYDLYVGRVLFKLPWSRIRQDFDPRSGNLLLFGMIFLAILPALIFWLT